jgi:hypothetical protein
MRNEPVPYNDSRRELHAAAKPTGIPAGIGRRAGAWFLHELREILPPTIFFFIGFNLIVLTTNLILSEYLAAFGNFMVATAAALIVGKAVLVTEQPIKLDFDAYYNAIRPKAANETWLLQVTLTFQFPN